MKSWADKRLDDLYFSLSFVNRDIDQLEERRDDIEREIAELESLQQWQADGMQLDV